MAPTKKNDAFCMESTILERIPRHRVTLPPPSPPYRYYYPTAAHPTAAYLTYMLLSDANNQSSSSLACEAANFWLFLTVVLVFLVAFCCICAARTWRFSTTFHDSTTFRFRVVFRVPTTPVVWGLAAFWATGGDQQAAHLHVGSHSSSSSGIL